MNATVNQYNSLTNCGYVFQSKAVKLIFLPHTNQIMHLCLDHLFVYCSSELILIPPVFAFIIYNT